MNCTKFIPPSRTFIEFYYYYSNFALFVSLPIASLTFYVILKQSKDLKSFKWLILNHSFWCITFELCMTSLKPLVFLPAVSGFPLGLLKNGNLKLSTFASYMIILIGSNSVASLLATLLSRYLLIFPATKWFSTKRGIYLTIIYLIIAFFVTSVICYPFLFTDTSEFLKMAIIFDPCLQNYFKEPGFAFLPPEMAKPFAFLFFILAGSILILSLFLAIYFIYLVKTNVSVATTKLSASLMISAIVQLSISIFFYLLPFTIFFGVIAFEILHFENFVILLFCFLSTHSILESFATLYFVTPYRKYTIKLFYQTISFRSFIIPRRINSIILW